MKRIRPTVVIGGLLALVGLLRLYSFVPGLDTFARSPGLRAGTSIAFVIAGIVIASRGHDKDWQAAAKALQLQPVKKREPHLLGQSLEAPIQGGTKFLETRRAAGEAYIVMGIRRDTPLGLELSVDKPGLSRGPSRILPPARYERHPRHDFKVADPHGKADVLDPVADRLDTLGGYNQLFLKDDVFFEIGRTLPDLETLKQQMHLLEELHARLT